MTIEGEHLPNVWHVKIVNIVPRGDSGVMVWAGISYGRLKQLHFINGNLNAQGPEAHSRAVLLPPSPRVSSR
jgi:hypothetical protein